MSGNYMKKINKKLIINILQSEIILDRLASQINELLFFYPNLKILSIQPRGFLLAKSLSERILNKFGFETVFGTIDPSFYRDDYISGSKLIIPTESNLNFEIEDQPVLLIDDVIFTGRTTRAAINALQDFGRPKWIKVLVLVNRHLERELPIEVDFEGIKIDSHYSQKIEVCKNRSGKIEICLIHE